MSETGRNTDFASVVEEIAAGRSSRELARIIKERGYTISHATISDMRWGTVPKYAVVEQFADGLGVAGSVRDRIFTAARYIPPERLEAVKRMVETEVEGAPEAAWKRLEQGGFDPRENPAETGAMILDAGLYRLSQRVGEFIPYSGAIPRDQLTPKQARAELADIEAELREMGRLKD